MSAQGPGRSGPVEGSAGEDLPARRRPAEGRAPSASAAAELETGREQELARQEQQRRELEGQEQQRREQERRDQEHRDRERREQERRAREAARAARRASPAGRRLSVRERGLWAWFIPDARRGTVAILGSLLGYVALRPLPGFEALGGEAFTPVRDPHDLSVLGTLFIAVTTLYSLLSTALTHWVRRHLDRRELVVMARLDRARTSVAWFRWVHGRTGARSEAVQMLVTCAVAVLVLLTRPAEVAVAIPLLATAGAVVAAWLSCVVGFAGEYAAEDAHGTALDMPGVPVAERGYEEYLDLAVLVQTTSGPPGVAGLTRPARRSLRSQSVLAHVMSTVIISLAVSVVLTALT